MGEGVFSWLNIKEDTAPRFWVLFIKEQLLFSSMRQASCKWTLSLTWDCPKKSRFSLIASKRRFCGWNTACDGRFSGSTFCPDWKDKKYLQSVSQSVRYLDQQSPSQQVIQWVHPSASQSEWLTVCQSVCLTDYQSINWSVRQACNELVSHSASQADGNLDQKTEYGSVSQNVCLSVWLSVSQSVFILLIQSNRGS